MLVICINTLSIFIEEIILTGSPFGPSRPMGPCEKKTTIKIILSNKMIRKST